MTLNRYAARRDENERGLVKRARSLGAKLWPLKKPCDWLMCFRSVWYVIEVKTEDGTFTEAEIEFAIAAADVGGKVLVWRTENDVLQTLGAQ